MGLLDAPFGENDGSLEMEERRIAPLLTTVIDDRILNSIKSGKTNTTFNSSDPIVIMNPCDV